MKATSKLRPPHPSAERPLQGGAWEFFISKLPACRHYIIKCSIIISLVLRCFRKCAKMHTFESERVIVVARLPGLFHVPYSGYFSGGKIFVSSEFWASSWENVRGRGILSHTPVLCGTVSWVKFRGSPLNHENHEKFTPRKIPAIREVILRKITGRIRERPCY